MDGMFVCSIPWIGWETEINTEHLYSVCLLLNPIYIECVLIHICGLFMLFLFCLCYTLVLICLLILVTCWERADLLALDCDLLL